MSIFFKINKKKLYLLVLDGEPLSLIRGKNLAKKLIADNRLQVLTVNNITVGLKGLSFR